MVEPSVKQNGATWKSEPTAYKGRSSSKLTQQVHLERSASRQVLQTGRTGPSGRQQLAACGTNRVDGLQAEGPFPSRANQQIGRVGKGTVCKQAARGTGPTARKQRDHSQAEQSDRQADLGVGRLGRSASRREWFRRAWNMIYRQGRPGARTYTDQGGAVLYL